MVLPTCAEWAANMGRAGPVLLDAGVRSVIVLAVAGMAVTAMRRASAAARHWVWILGIAGLLVLPALLGILPGWNVFPRARADRSAANQPAAEAIVNLPSPGKIVADAAPVESQRPVAPALSPRASGSAADHNDLHADESKGSSDAEAAPLVSAAAASPATPALPAITVQTAPPAVATGAVREASAAVPSPAAFGWLGWLVLTWLGGALLVLAHMLLGYLSLWRLERRCTRIADGNWRELLDQLRGQVGLRAGVRLLASPERTMPMTWGLFSTRILLPGQASDWLPDQRRSVLLHELGHVRRRDCLTQLLTQIACAMYWFNPLVWVAWFRIQVERERACDDLVLGAGARASAYAEHLLQSASATPVRRFVGAAVAMARPSTLEERVRAILDSRRNRGSLNGRAGILMALGFASVLVPVVALRAQSAPETRPETPAMPSPANPGGGGRAATVGGFRGGRVGGGGGSGDAGFGGGIGGAALPPGAAGGGFSSALTEAPAAATDQGPTCTLDATVYEVHLPNELIGQLNVDDLTKAAASPADFEASLKKSADARPLYRVSQSVRLSGDTISILASSPYVTNAQITNSGATINSVSYTQTGAIFNLAGKVRPDGGIDLDLNLRLLLMGEGTVPITDKVNAPIFRQATLSEKGRVEVGKPFVVISIDGASPNLEAVAYIARIKLGAPQAPAAATQGH